MALADSGRGGLPRTRPFRRVKPARLWSLAVAIAVLVNLGVVVALSQVSHLHRAAPMAPLAVRTLRQLETEPPPPPPEEARESVADQPETAVPFALPSLDLPATSPTSELSLSAIASLDVDLDLPLSIPAFSVFGPPGDGPPAPDVGPVVGAPEFDTPAQREGAFDLDRFYPRTARSRGITGSTRVRIAIAATGRVSGVTVLSSTPDGVFDQAAERLCRGLRYRPALAAGTAVASTQDVTIEWTLK